MQKEYLRISFALLLIIFISGCDKGIEPIEEQGYGHFSGTVTFSGHWPEGIKRTHVVVFKNIIQRSEDFFPPNISFVVDSIPYGSSSFDFNSIEDNYISIFQLGSGIYNYVVVAQSKTPDISLERKDWFVVGIYCINDDQTRPAKLQIRKDEITPNINIHVDFNNPPPQPPM